MLQMGQFEHLGVMVDCSRDAVYTVESFCKFIDIISKMGYNVLQIYTEDTYRLDDEPYFGYQRGAYTAEELKKINAYALSKGVELVPCIQTLAHLGGITRWQYYGARCVDDYDILLIDQPETYQLIEKMFQRCAECFTSRKINIGMDEAYAVGLGRYLVLHGYQPRHEILNRHLRKVKEIADKYGFTCMLWSDMFIKTANDGEYYPQTVRMTQEVIDSVPEGMELVYWDYNHTDKEHFSKMIDGHRLFRNELWYSCAAWGNLGFTPHNRYSFQVAQAALSVCKEKGVKNVLVTSWKDDGGESSLFSVLPALAFAASCVYGDGSLEKAAEIFKTAVGKDFETFLTLDIADWVNGDPGPVNPAKYSLYNDPFIGLLDYHLQENRGEYFKAQVEKLETLSKDEEYGYVFRTLACLCSVLTYKHDVGLLTRKAYQANDREALRRLATEAYPEIAARLEQLYDAFCAQWEKECKLEGFEVHDIRLGGLIRRVRHCQKLLLQYVNGEISELTPLKENPLPYQLHTEKGEGFILSQWIYTAMVKPMN